MAANPTCYVRFLHAIPDAPAVDLMVNGYKATENISFLGFTPYFAAHPGAYAIIAYPAGQKAAPVFQETIELQESMIYTFALCGALAEPEGELIVDTKRPEIHGMASIRYINLSPYNTSLSVSVGGKMRTSDLVYKEVTDYDTLSSGEYTFTINDDMTQKAALQEPKLALHAGKYYACYIVGFIDNKDSLKALVPLEGATYLELPL